VATVESIPCPRCGAAPDQVCTAYTGVELPTGHRERWASLFDGPRPTPSET